MVEVAAERDFQFCTEVLVRGEQLPPANEVRVRDAHLRRVGRGRARPGDILKIHVHTDSPEAVFSYAARWGRVETTKADDMRAQHRRLAHAERRAVAVVTDSSADLADAGPRPPPHRPGPAAGGVRQRDLPRPGRAQAGGVLPPAPWRAGAADHLPADPGRLRAGAARRPRGGGRGRRGAPLGAPCRAPSRRRRRRCGRPGSAGSTWWTAAPPRSASACWRSGAPSWRRRGGGGPRSPASWSGSGGRPACCSRWTRTTTCSAPAGSPAARPGSPACWT